MMLSFEHKQLDTRGVMKIILTNGDKTGLIWGVLFVIWYNIGKLMKAGSLNHIKQQQFENRTSSCSEYLNE